MQSIHHHHGKAAHEKDPHEDAGLDPHIWRSPLFVRTLARTITTALQAIEPDHRGVYEANFRQLVAPIDRLDNALRQIFGGPFGPQFMVFHPAWGCFAKEYGLKQVPIGMEGKNPKPAQLKELRQHARKSDVRVVSVQPQSSTKSASVVAREMDGQVVFADPLAANWLAKLREIAATFKAPMR